MKRDFQKLATKRFDLLVIGGGIVGAGIAWDATLRGLSCALVEQGDFASGTSSKTTKLVHGGIRYLETLDFKLVREAIEERGILYRNAPHLLKPLPFLIPVSQNVPRPWFLVALGVRLYDFLAGKNAIRRHRFFNRLEVTDAEPLLRETGVERAAVYFDAQMDDARMVLEVAKSAADSGAVPANHCRVVRFLHEGDSVSGAEVEDVLTHRRVLVRAAVVINATGPWADKVRQLCDPTVKPIVRPSKGIHLVYPDLGLRYALVLSARRDYRIFFLIPWNDLTLIGTTDTDCTEDPAQVRATSEEIDYLIDEANRILPSLRLDKSRVIATFAGVRPLVAAEKKDPWAISRGHLIHEDADGLISVVGGKFTTFRKIAQDVVDYVGSKFPERPLRGCFTRLAPLGPQERTWRSPEMETLLADLLKEGDISPPLVTHLVQRYGRQAKEIFGWIRKDRRWIQPICPHFPYVLGEVRFAVEESMALTLSDLLVRRLPVIFSPCRGLDGLPRVAEAFAEIAGWSAEETRRQIEDYRKEMKTLYSPAGSTAA